MHTCSECGQACTCAGDIEDHDTGDEFYDECFHCDGADYPDDGDDFEPGRIEADRLTPQETGSGKND